MSPLSVLRIWGLGLFSWALLGLGVYLAVEAYDEFDATTAQARVIDVDGDGVVDRLRADDDMRDSAMADTAAELEESRLGDADARRAAGEPASARRLSADNNWKAWALLAGAIACLGMSLVGYWPVSLFMGNSNGPVAAKIEPTRRLVVGRPDGSQLHVNIYGDEARPTLLMTHGWSLDNSAWDYVKGDLVKNYRVVTWDLAGLGKSRGPTNADFSLEKMAHDLESVISATSIGSPLILVGHSIGGMILQTFCRIFPDQLGQRVAGLALVHTTYTNPLRTITASTLVTALEKPLIIPLNYLTIALAPLAWLSNWQSYLNGSLHITTRLSSFAGHQTRAQVDHGSRLAAYAWPATIARGNLAMFAFDAQATLPQVQIPVLVVEGKHDRVTRPVASQHIEKLLPNDRPFLVDGGHLGYWEQAGHVSEALREFAQHVVAKAGSRPADKSVALNS